MGNVRESVYVSLALAISLGANLLTGQSECCAQISESQLTRFASDDTVIAAHFDLQTMLDLANKESEDFKYVDKQIKKQGGYELGTMKSFLVLFGHDFEMDADRDYFDPTEFALVGIEWNNEIEPQDLLDSWFSPVRDEFLDEDIEGFPFYKFNGDYYVPSLLFPNEQSLIMGEEKLIRKGFEGVQETDSIGGKLMSRLDKTNHVHLLLDIAELDEDQRNEFLELFLRDMGDEVGTEYVENARKVELKVNLNSNVPLSATIEMADEDVAEKLKSLIKSGIMMAPGAIDMARDSLEVTDNNTEEMVKANEALLDKAEEVVELIEVSRDGKVISLSVKKMGGLVEAVDMVISLQAMQLRMMERFLEEFTDDDPFGDGSEVLPMKEIEKDDGDGDDGDGDDGDGDDGDGDDGDLVN